MIATLNLPNLKRPEVLDYSWFRNESIALS